MTRNNLPVKAILLAAFAIYQIQAQITVADYERANGLRKKYDGLAVNVPGPATWIGETHRFWCRKSVKGGNEFVLFSMRTRNRRNPPSTTGNLPRPFRPRPARSSRR